MSSLRIFAFLLLSISLQAQDAAVKYATIDELITNLYGVISGPAGERDWDTFKNIFHPTAMMGSSGVDAAGDPIFNVFSPEQYIERSGAIFKKYDFYEKELQRKTQVFGHVAQVFTSYEFELTRPDGPVKRQGINCIQLIKDKDRWWVTNIMWHAASDKEPLPADMKG